jgi:hypothetical protein
MNFQQLSRNCTTAQKPVYSSGAYFEFKRLCVFLMCLRFVKKIGPKTFGPHCVYWQLIELSPKVKLKQEAASNEAT